MTVQRMSGATETHVKPKQKQIVGNTETNTEIRRERYG
jgi:hypothetical protein